MNNADEKNNLPNEGKLSNLKIYDLLKVKNPQKFHLAEAKKNVVKAIDSLRVVQLDLALIQFPKNKKINRAIIKELAQQLHNVNWSLLPLLEVISTYEGIKQSTNWLTNDDLKNLFESLKNPGDLL